MSPTQLAIIIPAFEAGAFLAEAIESALPAAADTEIVVVDDGSTDQTAQVARRYAPRVRLLSQEHQGQNAARNLGVASTTGRFMLFFDADDLLRAERLPAFLKALEDPAVAGAYGDFESSWKRPNGQWEAAPVCVPGEPADPLAAVLSGWFPAPSIMFRREALERVGGWNESVPTLTDRELLARFADAGLRLRHVPGLILHHRDHGNARQSRETPTRLSIAFDLLEHYRARFDRAGLWTDARRCALAAEYRRIAFSQLRSGDRAGARRSLERCLRVDSRFCPPGGRGDLLRLFAARANAGLAVGLQRAGRRASRVAAVNLLRAALRSAGLRPAPRPPLWLSLASRRED